MTSATPLHAHSDALDVNIFIQGSSEVIVPGFILMGCKEKVFGRLGT